MQRQVGDAQPIEFARDALIAGAPGLAKALSRAVRPIKTTSSTVKENSVTCACGT